MAKDYLKGLINPNLSGKIRDKPTTDAFNANLTSVVRSLGPEYDVQVTSGGQAAKGTKGKRTGSTRHDVDDTGHAGTADIVLTRNGQSVTPEQDPALYEKFFEQAAPKFSGMGHYAWGVHVGGGTEAFWGPDTTSATADPRFAKAASRGRLGYSSVPSDPARGVAASDMPAGTRPDLEYNLGDETVDPMDPVELAKNLSMGSNVLPPPAAASLTMMEGIAGSPQQGMPIEPSLDDAYEQKSTPASASGLDSVSRSASGMAEDKQLSYDIETALNAALPPPEDGKPYPSDIANQIISSQGRTMALDMGVPVEAAPTSVNEVVKSVRGDPTTPVIVDEETGEEVELSDEDTEDLRDKRRMMAADMLQVLGVGLGQMSKGLAVDTSAVQAQHQERRQYEDAQATAAEEKQQKITASGMMVDDLKAAGHTDLAQILTNLGPDGMASVGAEWASRRPSPTEGMSYQDNVDYLVNNGYPKDVARGIAGDDGMMQDAFKRINPDLLGGGDGSSKTAIQERFAAMTPFIGKDGLTAEKTRAISASESAYTDWVQKNNPGLVPPKEGNAPPSAALVDSARATVSTLGGSREANKLTQRLAPEVFDTLTAPEQQKILEQVDTLSAGFDPDADTTNSPEANEFLAGMLEQQLEAFPEGSPQRKNVQFQADKIRAGEAPASYVSAAMEGMSKAQEKTMEDLNKLGMDTQADTATEKEAFNKRVAKADLAIEEGRIPAEERGAYIMAESDEDWQKGYKFRQENATRQKANAQSVRTGGVLSSSIATNYPSLAGVFSTVESPEQLQEAMDALVTKQAADGKEPEIIRTIAALTADPAAYKTYMKIMNAKGGLSALTGNPVLNEMVANDLTQMADTEGKIAKDSELVGALENANGIVSAPGYSSGPLTGTVRVPLQKFATDLLGAEAAQGMFAEDDAVFGARILSAIRGEFFSHYRAIGSGATSDMEAKLYLDGMPSTLDSPLQATAVTQIAVRTRKRAKARNDAKRAYLIEAGRNGGDEAALSDRVAMEAAMAAATADMPETIEAFDVSALKQSGASREEVNKMLTDTGPNTVVRVINEDGTSDYRFARELISK